MIDENRINESQRFSDLEEKSRKTEKSHFRVAEKPMLIDARLLTPKSYFKKNFAV